MRVPRIAGIALFTTSLAGAQELPTYDVGWEREAGTEACPARAAFVAAVRERVGDARVEDGAPRKLDARLSYAENSWRSELRVTDRGVLKGSQQLESPAADCSDLFAALVAVAAVTISDATPAASPGPAEAATEDPKPVHHAPELARWPDDEPEQWPPSESAEPPVGPLSLELEFAQDFLFWPEREEVCSDSDRRTSCVYYGTLQPKTNNRVTSGLRPGNQRLLLAIRLGLSERFAVELRFGRAFGYENQHEVPRYFAWHGETGLRYWLAAPDAELRTYFGASFGGAQFDSKTHVTITDCTSDDQTAVNACVSGTERGHERAVLVYQAYGLYFVGVRVGAAYTPAKGHATITLGLSADYAFPRMGSVLQPSLGFGFDL